jgi:hypothetical protein
MKPSKQRMLLRFYLATQAKQLPEAMRVNRYVLIWNIQLAKRGIEAAA